MKNATRSKSNQSAHKQGGAALIISLILLVIMTIIGLAGIRGITQQERMAAHGYDRSLAFQATEATLREIEGLIEAKPPVPGASCALVDGLMLCPPPVIPPPPAIPDPPRWLQDSTTFNDWTSATTVGSGTLAVTPEYFVEFLGDHFECQPGAGVGSGITCRRYRISARSNDGTGNRSAVMLQSIYATD